MVDVLMFLGACGGVAVILNDVWRDRPLWWLSKVCLTAACVTLLLGALVRLVS